MSNDKINFDLDFLDDVVKEKPKTPPTSPKSITPKKKRDQRALWIFGAVAVFVLILIAASSGNNSSSSTTAPTPNPTITPALDPITAPVSNPTDGNSDNSASVPDNIYTPPTPSYAPAASTVPGCVVGGKYSATTGLSCSGDGSCSPSTTFDSSTDECVTQLQYCQNRYGSYASYDSTNNSCGCEAGYTENSSGQCTTPKTGYQVCGDMNATWDGYSLTSSGGYSCTCGTGYTSSADGKTCVAKAAKTGYQVCSDSFPNETWDGTYSDTGKYNCVCQAGYTYNSLSQSCE